MQQSQAQTMILVVEDNESFRQIYADTLKANGFRVEEAKDGQAALDFMKKEKPDLVLLDILLPKIDGWEVLRQMRQSPDLKNIPVLILTVLGATEDIQKGKELGASDYTVKGFYSPREIIAKIRALLAQYDIRKNIPRYRLKVIIREGDAYKFSEDFGYSKTFVCPKCGGDLILELTQSFGAPRDQVWFDTRVICEKCGWT